MKDQYACDINDFCKYAVLRSLAAAHRGRLLVCWMLTPPDERTDGGQIAYLTQGHAFRPVDPVLFDTLQALVRDGRRTVADIQRSGVLPQASFHRPVLLDGLSERGAYFETFWIQARPGDLVFFDPDNGFEVASVPKRRRNSSKFLYWDELQRAVLDGRSVCIYQHFPRVQRAAYTRGLLEQMASLAPNHMTFAICSSRVAYLVAAADERAVPMASASEHLVSRFGGALELIRLAA
jgi:hypothetical protein